MKKLFLLFLFTISVSTLSYSQVGLTLGYASAKAKVSGGGVSVNSESVGAISLGLMYDMELSDNLDLQPSVGFGFGVDTNSNNAMGLGVALQYYVSGRDSGFFVAPSLGFGLALEDVDTSLVKKTAFSGGIGLGFDISELITLVGGYSTQLSNSSNIDGIKIKGNAFGVGLQIKL